MEKDLDIHGHGGDVIVLRASKGPEDPYLVALTGAGLGPVHFIPVLDYGYLNTEELGSDLNNSDRFSGLVFTSQTAVDACIQSLSQSSDGWKDRLAKQWKEIPVFVVGKATSQAVAKLGIEATGSFSGNAEALSRVIIDYFTVQGQKKQPPKPLLFPCGNLRKDTLPRAMEEAGIGLKSLVCYQTLPHSEIEARLQAIKIAMESIWIVFFSPSGVTFSLELIKQRFNKVHIKVAAIGPSTADALSKAGVYPNVVSKEPTPNSLVEGIILTHTPTNPL